MTQLVAKYAMKKVLGKEMEKYKSKDVAGPYVSNTFFAPTRPQLTPLRTPTTKRSRTLGSRAR
jgi:hypothetical protein